MASFFDIVPALGHGLVTAQGQAGGYDAIDDRRYWGVGRQEGALLSTSYKVSQRSAGANLTVDVSSEGGAFLVQGDSVLNQGLYHIAATALKTNLDLATSPDPTNPRIDQVVIEARDHAHTGDGITRARLLIISGTPTAGATLVNRTGAAALPINTARLADILVAANAASIVTANINDRRQWARGAYKSVTKTNGSVTSTVNTLSVIAGLLITMECSGLPLEIELGANGANSTGQILTGLHIDGAQYPSNIGALGQADGANAKSVGFKISYTPTAGRHTFQAAFRNASAGTADFGATADSPATLFVRELLMANTDNT